MQQPIEPQPQREVVRETSITAFSGPLPPPTVFEAYDKILPGAADRVLKMAEGQSSHRQFLERIAIWGDLAKEMTGTVLAYVAFWGAMFGAVYLLIHDKPIEGLGAFVVAVGSAIGPKIYFDLTRARDPDQKNSSKQ